MFVSLHSPVRRRAVFAALVTLVAVAAAVAAADLKGPISVAGSEAQAAEVAGSLKIGLKPGYYPPDFTLPSVGGETIRLSQFRGEARSAEHLWSVACGPCRQELNELKPYISEQGGSAGGRGYPFPAVVNKTACFEIF